MADTKLTREWVEKELANIGSAATWDTRWCAPMALYVALCRHYLATEQDARDAERWRTLRDSLSSKPHCTTFDMPTIRVPLHEDLTYTVEGFVDAVDQARAALTQKESQT